MNTSVREPASKASEIYKMVCKFFAARTHTSKGSGSLTGVGCATSDSLLRLVCLGSPERTIQGELVAFLRHHKLDVVAEVGFNASGNRRNIDIVAFNCKGAVSAAIELKHFSANQGAIGKLMKDVRSDRAKKFPSMTTGRPAPRILVGLYTEIVSVAPCNSKIPTNGIFRFLRTYYKDRRRTKDRTVVDEVDKFKEQWQSRFRNDKITSYVSDVSRFSAFNFPERVGSATVCGRVGSIVILAP